jgi:hypothetical protein
MTSTQNHRPEAFCSFDTEIDGTNPLEHSMRSIGIGLFIQNTETLDIELIDTFYKTLLPQERSNGSKFQPDPRVMKDFWDKHPIQWKAVNEKPQSPTTVMYLLSRWLNKHSQNYQITWVASPANCDWMWLKCYYEFYGPSNKPSLGYQCKDLDTLIDMYMTYHRLNESKIEFKKRLSQNNPYTHHALDDAVCQGYIYMNLRNLLQQQNPHK